jgi:RNA polymerase sigma-70 factor (ECF subfamily)
MQKQNELRWRIAREIPHLRRYAFSLLRSEDDADDLVQDCLERALRKRHLWRNYGSVRSWLFRILYHVFINQRVRLQRRGTAVSLEDTGDVRADPPRQEAHMACVDTVSALEKLPAEQRAAILLIALEGLPYDEAAYVLDIPVGTLRSRLSRGREALRRMGAGTSRQQVLRRVK